MCAKAFSPLVAKYTTRIVIINYYFDFQKMLYAGKLRKYLTKCVSEDPAAPSSKGKSEYIL